MNKQIAKNWVEALRSGQYEQGKHQLQVGNKFCCLGVLCKIAQKAKIKVNLNKNKLLGTSLMHQSRVKQWAEIKQDIGVISNSLVLVSLNDNGNSFSEIADIIEKEWENL
jgi:hypothetical protein